MHLADLNHPDDRRLDRPLIKELLNGRRRSFAVEKRYVHADGHLIHALIHVSLMHGDGERPLYFLCQLVDITERRRAEAEQRAGAGADAGDHRQLAGAHHRQGRSTSATCSSTAAGRRSSGSAATRWSAAPPPRCSADRSPGTDDMDREVLSTGERLESMATMPGRTTARRSRSSS